MIAPWREWDLNSREKLMAFAESRGIPVEQKRGTAAPYSMDANLLHISYEGGELEDPAAPPPPGNVAAHGGHRGRAGGGRGD